jgi:16S rRNA (cytidine1402-2'-O)-methyltransferase
MEGTLYLIPIPISEEPVIETITKDVADKVKEIQYFAVENIRTARRFIKSVDRNINIDSISFFEINPKISETDKQKIVQALQSGKDVGVMSEAGAPGIADPGSDVVLAVHLAGISVMPLIGASSIMLALMGSGLNGQRFAFQGYLPVKAQERQKALKQLERESAQWNQTQIFIETPYRNQHMFDEIIKTCNSGTLVTIAMDLTGKEQLLKTKTIEAWKREKLEFPKKPAIFALLAFK